MRSGRPFLVGRGKEWQRVPREPLADCTGLGAPLEVKSEDTGKGGTPEKKNREVKKELVWEGKLMNSIWYYRICIIGKNLEAL